MLTAANPSSIAPAIALVVAFGCLLAISAWAFLLLRSLPRLRRQAGVSAAARAGAVPPTRTRLPLRAAFAQKQAPALRPAALPLPGRYKPADPRVPGR